MTVRAAEVAALPDGGRFVALDALRGLAALGIAINHLDATRGVAASQWADGLSYMVDFFFVLSGFVIAAAYGDRLTSGFSIIRFALLRLGRLYPLHLAMVALYLVIETGLGLVMPEGASRVPFTSSRDPATLPEVLLLVQAFTRPQQDIWNAPSWSISVELWLYLLAAIAWRWLGRRAVVGGLALAVAAMALADFAPAPWIDRHSWALRGVAGFGLGMAIWPLYSRLATFGARVSVTFATIAEATTISLLMWLVPWSLLTPIDLVNAVIVLVFAQQRGLVSRLLCLRPFVWLGAVSYSLYMVHGLVLGRAFDAVGMLQGKLGLTLVHSQLTGVDLLAGSLWQQNLLAVVFVALCLPAAWLAWRFVEWPARQWSRRKAASWGAAEGERSAPTM